MAAALADPLADPDPPAAAWAGDGDAWTLRVSGRWAAAEPPALPDAPVRGTVAVDARGMTGWTPAGAAALWRLLNGVDRRQAALVLDGLPAGLREILALALPPADAAAPSAAPRRHPHWLATLGQGTRESALRVRETLDFVGRVLQAAGRALRGGSAMRGADLAWQFEQTGPRSVPIVALVCGLVGLILAYMGAAQLQLFGAQAFIADLVAVGMVREIAALMTAVILSGRVGAAFAAQLGSMQANDEIDALRSLGVDPVEHLVLPRLLAMVLVAPLLTAVGALVGLAAGALVAVLIFGISPWDYLQRSVQALTPAHVAIGLFKGTVYAALVAMAGCRQGLAAGRSAQAVGQATTAAVVQAIVWIVVAASVLTILFQRLGW